MILQRKKKNNKTVQSIEYAQAAGEPQKGNAKTKKIMIKTKESQSTHS